MGDFPLQPGHFRSQPDDFLAQRGDQFPQRMNECVFLRVRQVSKIGQSFHAAYCQLSLPFLNPDQRLFYGENLNSYNGGAGQRRRLAHHATDAGA